MTNTELIITALSPTEQISLGLAVLSVVLGTIAIFQAFFYKREQERQAKVQEKNGIHLWGYTPQLCALKTATSLLV